MTSSSPLAALRGRMLLVGIVSALILVVVGAVMIGGAETLELPEGVSRDLAYQMYGEQVDSAESINELVSGEIKTLELLDGKVESSTAEFTVRATNRSGAKRSGIMRLAKAGGTWYFESITRSGYKRGPGFNEEPDLGVLNTLLDEQSKNTSITAQFVEGKFDTIKVAKPKKGYRSVSIPVTFSGSAKSVKGQVTAVQRTNEGRDQWFIVSFQ